MRSDSGSPSGSPDELFPEFEEAPIDRKTRQLCKQVHRVLSSVLSGEMADDDLQSLAVEAVVPAPNAGRLRVVLLAFGEGPTEEVLRERLTHVRAFLRSQVAQAIHRKRAPELAFEVVRLPRRAP